MIKQQTYIKFKKTVLSRYEESIKDGTVFLYNAEDNQYWTGNTDCYNIIKVIGSGIVYHELVSILSEAYSLELNKVDSLVRPIIQEFIDKEFLGWSE